jgi:hypothetical protein
VTGKYTVSGAGSDARVGTCETGGDRPVDWRRVPGVARQDNEQRESRADGRTYFAAASSAA